MQYDVKFEIFGFIYLQARFTVDNATLRHVGCTLGYNGLYWVVAAQHRDLAPGRLNGPVANPCDRTTAEDV
jgi:hypothetical protein